MRACRNRIIALGPQRRPGLADQRDQKRWSLECSRTRIAQADIIVTELRPAALTICCSALLPTMKPSMPAFIEEKPQPTWLFGERRWSVESCVGLSRMGAEKRCGDTSRTEPSYPGRAGMTSRPAYIAVGRGPAGGGRRRRLCAPRSRQSAHRCVPCRRIHFGAPIGSWLLTVLPQRAVRWGVMVFMVAVIASLFMVLPSRYAVVEIDWLLGVGLVELSLFTTVMSGLLEIGGK